MLYNDAYLTAACRVLQIACKGSSPPQKLFACVRSRGTRAFACVRYSGAHDKQIPTRDRSALVCVGNMFLLPLESSILLQRCIMPGRVCSAASMRLCVV